MTDVQNRCRLVLVASPAAVKPEKVLAAIKGGDVASIILFAGDVADHDFTQFCEALVKPLQDHDIAVLIADNTQVFGRIQADGYFASKSNAELADDIARFSPHNIVGCGSLKDRHQALQVGELKPDVVMFGKLDGDIRPEPHHKNIALAQWWSEFVEMPCILMGGDDLEFTKECAETRADFVSFSRAVFENAELEPAAAVKMINELLDQHAPNLNEEIIS